ncbi:selenium-dependent xanthine dehydrogenase [bacterium CPR1]|nr:selenium-dependent xanthine dehydrogenase [bacterium CPR1]
MELNFELNGQRVSVECPPEASLLDILRESLGIWSVKNGCAPMGQCGCCLVLVDGRPLTSCAIKAEKAQGRSVQTLEGLSCELRERYARAFVATAGMQCGFCIPGMVLRAHALLEKTPSPTRADMARALDGHLCRCTGYLKIFQAVEAMVRGAEPCLDGRVGCPLGRYDGLRQALGDRPYVDDLSFPGMLRAVLVFSPHARARVKQIRVDSARALPGVVAVATAADVPGERWYGLVLSDWPAFVAEGEEVRCVGDVLAAVAAVDEATARAAAALIEVDYEPLEPVLQAEDALTASPVNSGHPGGNVLSHTRVTRGDVVAARAASAHVVEGVWTTQRIEHCYLEPESAVAVPLEGGVKLYTQGQGIFDDRRQVAALLGWTEEQVEVELVPNGGAFGGKEDMSVQAQTALLAVLTGRPVKLTLSRLESIRLHPKRHPIRMRYAVGCDSQGHLTFVEADLLGDSGAYASVGMKVLERAAGHACGPYRVANVEVQSRAVYTNNPPCGAMRGFGVNQTAFAIEGCLDELAARVGLDGWEIRWRNALQVGDTFSTGQVLTKSVGIKATLQAVRKAYYEALTAGQAVGIACGLKNSGLGNGAREWGKARLVVEPDGSISIYNGYTEMGQGLLTVLVQCAVEVTGLSAALFRPKVDTTFALGCGQTTGSRATLFGGRAVVAAAEKLKADLEAGLALTELVGRVYVGDVLTEDTTRPGALGPIKTHTTFGYATQVVLLDGEGRLERVVAAHDVGRAINPALCEGQIEGSVHMGLGYALSEELPCQDGHPVPQDLRTLGVLRARDMPVVEVILVEDPEPEGPFGAKGVGEIGLVPTAAAVAGALERFDGVRRRTLPMKDSPTARALSVGKLKGDRANWS